MNLFEYMSAISNSFDDLLSGIGCSTNGNIEGSYFTFGGCYLYSVARGNVFEI